MELMEETAEQLSLVDLEPRPKHPPRAKTAEINVNEIILDGVHMPSKPFLELYETWGPLETITVADAGDAGYHIIAGHRRVGAAIALKIEMLPALVFDYEEVHGYIRTMAVVSNESREPNRVANFDAIAWHVSQGRGVEEIAKMTGLTVPTVSFYTGLLSVHPEILDAWHRRKISDSTVKLVAKTPRGVQNRLVAHYLPQGRVITSRAVREEWKTVVEAEGNLFDGDAIAEWTNSTINTIQNISDTAPLGVPSKAIECLRSALDSLKGRGDAS
jgi:hypothetical protein